MAGTEKLDVAGIAGAIGGLKAEVSALGKTTAEGFEGLNHRLDQQNGRLRTVEGKATEIAATSRTAATCETIRAACLKDRTKSARTFLVSSSVGIAVAIVSVIISKLVG